MEDKTFAWTPEITQKLFELRYENDWLFKKKKQPWGEFHEILLQNGFPETMTINHVRKKWSYSYDMYKIAKKTKNKDWKYYKLFEKIYAKSKILDKYESWSDEWRLKLITCIIETKGLNLDFRIMWITIERAMRCQDLPIDCCIQDMKGLWQHIRTTFNRKHRLKIKKGAELTEWPLYDVLLNYFNKCEPEYLPNLENESAFIFMRKQRDATKYIRKRRHDTDIDDDENEFIWTKDITESFIQVRLQNDWLFREKKWAWNDLLKIMINEYGFPKSLTSREICKKWASTFGEYQKSKATNNKSWVYYHLFELYLGEGNMNTLNLLISWQEDWIFKLITARTELDYLFEDYLRDPSGAWREVEKRLRNLDLPLDHSLLDMPDIWTHLIRTFRWKRKFANKGILTETWPFYNAMLKYVETKNKRPILKRKLRKAHSEDNGDFAHEDGEDFEDDMKLFDLKQKLQVQEPKMEYDENKCRTCYTLDGSVNVFNEKDNDGVELAYKLKLIGGVEVDKSDNFPSQICFNCLLELENAYKFRRKCQETDKEFRNISQQFRNISQNIKIEGNDQSHDDNRLHHNINNTKQELLVDDNINDFVIDYDSDTIIEKDKQKQVKKERVLGKRKKVKKMKYEYNKICEICGKHTRNLVSHLDAHTTIKAYSCDICNKKFKFKSGLIIHKAIHDPTPKKTCEVCGKTFHVLAQYRRHFVYHANERKYECETCGKRFNSNDILKVHNRIHTDERPFSCQDCGKTFRTAGCVSRHRRIVHRTVKLKPK